MDAGVDVKVDDSKVHILRGPASCRQLALDVVKAHLTQLMNGKHGPITQDEYDLEQTYNWLLQLKVE